MERRCYCKILHILFKERVSNEEVCSKIQQAIGPHEDLLAIINIEVAWTCLPFIRSGQIRLARHGEREKKTRQTDKVVGRQHQGMGRLGVCQVPEGCGEQRKMEETGCEVICSAPTTPAVKEYVKKKSAPVTS